MRDLFIVKKSFVDLIRNRFTPFLIRLLRAVEIKMVAGLLLNAAESSHL